MTINDNTPTQGSALTGSNTITDEDGLPATLGYQWQQSDVGGAGVFADIAGATNPTFTPGAAQINRRLVLRVSYVDAHQTAESTASDPTGIVGGLFTGTAAADVITGTPGSDIIIANAGNDTINALAGADVVTGGAGNDTIDAGPGQDLMQMTGTGDGADAVTGGAGDNDRVQATVENTQVGLSSIATVEVVSNDGFANVRIEGTAGADTLNFTGVTLTGITAINGLAGNDTLTGSAAADRINGAGGDDTLDGAGGNDTLVAGPIATMGSDALTGGAGTDTVDTTQTTIGLARLQTMESLTTDAPQNQPLQVQGTDAANVLDFSTLNNSEVSVVNGLGGNDTITGTAGTDDFRGGDGNDTLNTGAAADRVTGGAGDDAINAGAGNDTVLFTGPVAAAGTPEGADAVTGGAGTDTVQASAAGVGIGLSALATVEAVTGPAAAPPTALARIEATGGADTLNFSAVTVSNIASVNGLAGQDELTGTPNADTLIGAAGADTLTGLGGPDVLDGGAGNDTMNGGAGNDQFRLQANFGADTVQQFNAAGDLLNVAALGVTGGAGGNFAARVTIAASGGGTLVTITNGGSVQLAGVQPAAVTQADFTFAP